MQSQADRDASLTTNGNGQKSISIEDAVGNSFMRLLAEEYSQDNPIVKINPDDQLIQAFAKDVRRRKEEPPGSYEDFVDLAASAAVRVLIYGPHTPDRREDPSPLTLYRRLLCLVKRASPETKPSSETRPQPASEGKHRADRDDELETAKRRQLLGGAYDSGFSAGFEAGARAEASKRQTSAAETEAAYAQGFAAGQRRLMDSEIAFAFTRGQEAEKERIRAGLEKMGEQGGRARLVLEGLLGETTEFPGPWQHTRPESASTTDAPAHYLRQHSGRGSTSSPPARFLGAPTASHAVVSSPAGHQLAIPQALARASERNTLPRKRRGGPQSIPDERGDRNAVATCVFCGIQLSQNSILRHKRRHHPAELAAVGVPLHICPCWWPGCGQLQDNLVHSQLTTHLQRKHNFSPPGDSNAFTENIRFLKRMPMNLQISIIAEAAQQLNAVKLRIQDLEARLRRVKPTYISRHGLPDVRCLESRPRVLSAILQTRGRLPYIIQELRQLTRARGMRSQLRNDEGTWWEVADDLEAGLDPSSKLARAVMALSPPGSGPTIHLNANTFSEAPNMKDSSWKPQYAVPLQAGWEVTGPDDNPVWTRTGPEARGGTSVVAEPAIKNEPEDDEEDGSYRDLMAEISRRVLDGHPQSDWDESGSDEGEYDSVDAESDAVRDKIGTPQKRNVSMTMSPLPRMVKHRRIF